MSQVEPNPLFPGKFFISTVLEALQTKTTMSGPLLVRYLQRAAMAGVIIGLMYATNYALISVFADISLGETSLLGIGKIAGALAFGWALVFIYYTKSELLTSNMMIVTVGGYYHEIGLYRSSRLLFFCYVGNFIGGLFVALCLALSTILDPGTLEQMVHGADVKLAYVTEGPVGWVDLFIRAVLCNFMINLSMLIVYSGNVKGDVIKSLIMVMAVFVFAFLAFEHSVANTVLFTIVGLQEGIDVLAAGGNILLALAGNFVGGGLLIGLYYAYANDDERHRRLMERKQGRRKGPQP